MSVRDVLAHVVRKKPITFKARYEEWEADGHQLSVDLQESVDVAQAMIDEWGAEVVSYKAVKRSLDEKLLRK